MLDNTDINKLMDLVAQEIARLNGMQRSLCKAPPATDFEEQIDKMEREIEGLEQLEARLQLFQTHTKADQEKE